MDAKQFAELLKENNKQLAKDLQDGVKAELKAFKEEIKDEIKYMVAQSLAQTNDEIVGLRETLSEKETEIATLKERTLDLEFEARKKNIILFKISESELDRESLITGLVKLIQEVADPSFTGVEIDDAYRLGKKSKVPRPIIVILNRSSKRNLLLSKKRKFMEKNVGISEDLPKEVYADRKSLFTIADDLRKEGKKVVFRKDKMLVDGKVFTTKEVERHGKRRLSLSPGEGTSNSTRRTQPRLTIEIPHAQPSQSSMERYFTPIRNSGVFSYVSDK
jgi:hypothetical protein